MTASLYQSGSSLESVLMEIKRSRGSNAVGSNEVVEITLRRAAPGFDTEHAGRAFGWRQRHENARPLPLVASTREQLVCEIWRLRVERPFGERHVDKTAL